VVPTPSSRRFWTSCLDFAAPTFHPAVRRRVEFAHAPFREKSRDLRLPANAALPTLGSAWGNRIREKYGSRYAAGIKCIRRGGNQTGAGPRVFPGSRIFRGKFFEPGGSVHGDRRGIIKLSSYRQAGRNNFYPSGIRGASTVLPLNFTTFIDCGSYSNLTLSPYW